MKSKTRRIVKKIRSWLLLLIAWIVLAVLYALSYFGVAFEDRKPSLIQVFLGLFWLVFIIWKIYKCIKDENEKS